MMILSPLLRSGRPIALMISTGLLMAAAPMLGHAEGTDHEELHFALSKSSPTDGATISGLQEVRLWFTQVPQDNSIAIRLVDGSGELVETGDVAQDAEDASVFSVSVGPGLPAGSYTVAWRGIGQDGHTVRGEFAFELSAR